MKWAVLRQSSIETLGPKNIFVVEFLEFPFSSMQNDEKLKKYKISSLELYSTQSN